MSAGRIQDEMSADQFDERRIQRSTAHVSDFGSVIGSIAPQMPADGTLRTENRSPARATPADCILAQIYSRQKSLKRVGDRAV